MKFFIVLSALAAVAMAKPSYPHVVAPLAYAHVVPGAPIGVDGRVVDTPEVAVAKAEHAAAHINEKVALAHEAVKSADVVAYSAAPAVVSAYSSPAVISAYAAPLAYAHGHAAPTGIDGRVVDTPEVAVAKAEHAAAHINEKFTLANEAAKNYAAYSAPAVVAAYSAPAVVPAAYSAYAAPVVSAYSAYHAAPAVVSAYSSLSHSIVPSVSVW